MNYVVAILGLALLVLVHEAGHFFAARAVGMRPRKFYLGFPPAVVKTVRGGVEYGIGAIPLGGYVKIPGMHRPSPGELRATLKPEQQERLAPELEELDEALARGDERAARAVLPSLRAELGDTRVLQDLDGSLAPDAYWRQATWRRIVAIAAGPAVNVVVAVVLFMSAYMVGTSVPTRQVAQVVSSHPAAAAGVMSGDVVVSVAGHSVTPDTLSDRINATHGRAFTLVVYRDGRLVKIGPLRARWDVTEHRYIIGIQLKLTDGPGQGLAEATSKAAQAVWSLTDAQLSGIAGLVHGQGTRQVSSSVGIVRDTAQQYKTSFSDYLAFVGYISLALGLLNLLPILPLDGGHIVMSILERLRGRTFTQLAYLRYSAVGLTLFMFLLYLGLRNDLFLGSG